MADLQKLLDAATKGPWAVEGTRHSGNLEIGPGTRLHMVGPDGDAVAAVFFDMKTGRGFMDARLIALAPQLAAALIKAEEVLAESVEIVHKEYVRATLETVNAGPHHLLQKQMDAWRVRCMNAEKVSRAALSEIRALTGGRHD